MAGAPPPPPGAADAAGAGAGAARNKRGGRVPSSAPTRRQRPSQSDAQRRYREKQKQRVNDLEMQVQKLSDRVRELEMSGADSAVLVHSRIDATPEVLTELKKVATDFLETLRQAYWTESDAQLRARVMGIMPSTKRLKLMLGQNPELAVGLNINLTTDNLEYWKSVVRRAELPIAKLRAVVKWRDDFVATLQAMQRKRMVEIRNIQRANDQMDSSDLLSPMPTIVNSNASRCGNVDIRGRVIQLSTEITEACTAIRASIAEQETFIDQAVIELFDEEYIGPRGCIRMIILSAPIICDAFGIVNAVTAVVSEIDAAGGSGASANSQQASGEGLQTSVPIEGVEGE